MSDQTRDLPFGIDFGAADFRATGVRTGFSGSRFTAVTPDGPVEVAIPLPGRFNVLNALAALAAARVSIALGGISSGAAIETADVVLMADDLSRLPWLIRHSRKTLDRIRQNIGLALCTKAVVLILALFGIAELWTAIAADVGISLIVIANALRLLRN